MTVIIDHFSLAIIHLVASVRSSVSQCSITSAAEGVSLCVCNQWAYADNRADAFDQLLIVNFRRTKCNLWWLSRWQQMEKVIYNFTSIIQGTTFCLRCLMCLRCLICLICLICFICLKCLRDTGDIWDIWETWDIWDLWETLHHLRHLRQKAVLLDMYSFHSEEA